VGEVGVLVHNEGSAYNGTITDPMQILYSLAAPLKKTQISAALKEANNPITIGEEVACNGPTGFVCTGMAITGHIMDDEFYWAGAIAEDRATANVLGVAVGYGIGKLFGIGKSFSAVPGKLQGKVVNSTSQNIKYLGRIEDLKGIPRSQTILDDLPDLGTPRANYYQNMSVIRKNLREGVTFKDASSFRPNSELAPTITWPTRTIGQTFYGAERNFMQNRELWPK
jgi:hypothetical protein